MPIMSSAMEDKAADAAIKYLELMLGGRLDEDLKVIVVAFAQGSKELWAFAKKYQKVSPYIGTRSNAKAMLISTEILVEFLEKKGIIMLGLAGKLSKSDAIKCIAASAQVALDLATGSLESIGSGGLLAVAALGMLLLDVGDVAEACGPYLTSLGGKDKVTEHLTRTASESLSR